MIGGKTVSVVTGCRDRESHLQQALPTWLAAEEVDEVVVVDWSSRDPLATSLRDHLDRQGGRLVLAVADHQPRWHLSRCLNLGIQVATGDVVLKLDSDVRLLPGFFEANSVEEDHFRAGDDLGIRAPLWGNIVAFRSDLLRVKGYDERLVGYGWDDEDLYQRLQRAGVIRQHLDFSLLDHIDHGDGMRIGDQACSLQESTYRNVASSTNRPWGGEDRMAIWRAVASRGDHAVAYTEDPTRSRNCEP